MSALADTKRRLREKSEHYLMLAAMRDVGAGRPGTFKAYPSRDGLLWRMLFVPPERRPGEPWRPPQPPPA